MPDTHEDRVKLGATEIDISPLGIGTWAWGDKLMWDYGAGGFTDEDLRRAFDEAIEAGVNWFDTAEVYGFGRSEELVGRFVAESGAEVKIATKFMPMPWRLSPKTLLKALRASLERLGLPAVDLYQVHFPFPPLPVETWMDAMAGAVEAGLVRAVGVSNYSMQQMGRAFNALAERGIPLASNQVYYSLLHREPERNGVAQLCRDLGVTLIAYSPLEKGILTGKYTPENPPPSRRSWIYRQDYLERVQPLLNLMREIGEGHGGKSQAQVALNWVICKGAVPIPGAKKARHAVSNAGAMGWRLTGDEVAALDEASAEF